MTDRGGISHDERHIAVEARLSSLEKQYTVILLLLVINVMLTTGDLVTKIGPIVKTFAYTLGHIIWSISLLQ